jgi:hypothetical protein
MEEAADGGSVYSSSRLGLRDAVFGGCGGPNSWHGVPRMSWPVLWAIRGGCIVAAMDGSVIWEIKFPGARMHDLGDRVPWRGCHEGGVGRGCHGLARFVGNLADPSRARKGGPGRAGSHGWKPNAWRRKRGVEKGRKRGVRAGGGFGTTVHYLPL